ncbi:hypothetical protein THAOC_37882 [Thalassiosira oceanica]|uniref:Uncharacterized protein n=1 Tax=Thalassiosira oceanica TaxID=159749 RepID=K0QY44_THAOC|nr:hypothetical protein THAOC_37882 [Thalassiosira oceanica]|eukprot:EJK43653.1 hypothetical protein THAOC_37882 [Thalassiosira oceanica]
MAGDAEGGDGGGTRSYFIRVREHGRAGEEDGRTTDAAPAGSSRHESDRVPPGGAAFGGVTSSNACRDALVSCRDPSDGRLDRDAYVRFVNELSGDAFTSFQYDESGGSTRKRGGGPFIICDAFLYAGGADAGSDPSRDAQQEAYLSRLCLGVERAIDEAMQEPAVTGRPTAEPTASPTTEQPTASPAVVLTAAVPLSSQVVVSEAGDTPASGGFADGRGPPSGKVAYAATRNLTSFLIATLVTIMVCLAAFVTYTRRRVLRRMRRELEDDAAKMKGKKERRRRGRRRRTGEEEEENSGVIHDVESQTSQDNTAAGSAEFSEMEGHDCDSNCIREEEREVGVSGIGARTQEGATKVQPVV